MIFCPNGLHDLAALRAQTRLLGQLVGFFLNLRILRKNLSGAAGALLSGMGFDLNSFLRLRFRLLFRRLLADRGLVEQQAELFIALLRELF